ncbi:protein of unknown function [Pseudodesulfovibrio profundus]|uniref:Uncharacterized protein n=1 Tax=Pseudodesulfovibrio profundus TaxID=57320 RepID=A0A2C8F3L1_9BACT|nr:hypothetical protein [Pseudodesulfovibrio profundus]SOB56983.1 protein of unknown function [Pseudodesulfovibrio profundus]
MKKRVVFIKEFCEIMGLTEHSVRSHLQRSSLQSDGIGVLPKPFKLGRKLAWTTDMIMAFLEKKELEAVGFDSSQKQLCKNPKQKG